MPKSEIDNKLSEAHFLILMRPISRYSMAGFPLNVPEALAAGVPIITNYTSDLEYYINDGENGLIVSEFTSSAFANAVRRALIIQNSDFKIMSLKARETANQYFNYEVFTSEVREFLDRCELFDGGHN